MKHLMFAVLLVALTTAEAFENGNSVLAKCVGDSGMKSACYSYISGVVDAHFIWVNWYEMSEKMCVPSQVTNEHLRRVVLKYLEERPEILHLVAAGFVLVALAEAFPCEP